MNSDKSFSIQLIGDTSNLSGFPKEQVNDELEKFIETFQENFNQGALVIDVTYKKGHFMKGRHKGIPLVNTKVRFQTDKGKFFAEKENWGINAALHDALLILSQQIREQFSKKHNKVHVYSSERRTAEA